MCTAKVCAVCVFLSPWCLCRRRPTMKDCQSVWDHKSNVRHWVTGMKPVFALFSAPWVIRSCRSVGRSAVSTETLMQNSITPLLTTCRTLLLLLTAGITGISQSPALCRSWLLAGWHGGGRQSVGDQIDWFVANGGGRHNTDLRLHF